jgi:1-acyl-sn-glycerol-3-phosphate acyltransferase
VPHTPEVVTGRLPRLSQVDTEPAEPALVRVVWLLNGVTRRLTRRQWQGQDRVPRHGGVVFAVNHISNLDPIVFGQYLAYAGRYPHYLGKASLFTVPVVGRIITACGQIPVERGTHNAASALTRAIEAVRGGTSITVFPEGTITWDPDLWPMVGKTGVARIALEADVPVIPVGTWGAQTIIGAKKVHFPRLFPRATLQVTAGEPVDLDDLRTQPLTPAVLREATERIMTAITALVAELRGLPAPTGRYDPRTRERVPLGTAVVDPVAPAVLADPPPADLPPPEPS